MIRSRFVKKAYGIIYMVITFAYLVVMFRGAVVESRIEDEIEWGSSTQKYIYTGDVYKEEVEKLKKVAVASYGIEELDYRYGEVTVDPLRNRAYIYIFFGSGDDETYQTYHGFIDTNLTADLKMDSFIDRINETTGIIKRTVENADSESDGIKERFEDLESKNLRELMISLALIGLFGFIEYKFFKIGKDELDEYELQKIIDKWEEMQENGKRMYIARTFVFMVLQIAIPPILLHGTDFDMQHIIGMSFLYFFIVILYTWVSAGVGLEKKEKAYWEAKEMLESMKSKDKRNKSKEEIV